MEDITLVSPDGELYVTGNAGHAGKLQRDGYTLKQPGAVKQQPDALDAKAPASDASKPGDGTKTTTK